MTPFMLVSAMCVKLVITVESFIAETTFRMTFETALIDRSRVVITSSFMFAELGSCEELVLMCEYLFVPCAKITGRC